MYGKYRAVFANGMILEQDSLSRLKSAIKMEIRYFPESVIDKYGIRCLVPIYDNDSGEIVCALDSLSGTWCRLPETL